MKPAKFAIVVFYILALACASFGQSSVNTTDELQEIVERLAKTFEYEAMRAYAVIPDKWDADDKKILLNDHRYLTLLGKDSDRSSCLSMEGRIGVTILIFKNSELAIREVENRRTYHAGNIGFKVNISDNSGFIVKDGNGVYSVFARGPVVIYLEDRSSTQAEVIKFLHKEFDSELSKIF